MAAAGSADEVLDALGPLLTGGQPPFDLIVSRVAASDLVAAQLLSAVRLVPWERPVTFLTMFDTAEVATPRGARRVGREISLVRSIAKALLLEEDQ